MRQLVAVLTIAALLPLTVVPAASSEWDDGSRDTHTVSAPPDSTATSVVSRAGTLDDGIPSVTCAAPISTAIGTAAFRATAGSAQHHGQTRWCIGHSTSTSIS